MKEYRLTAWPELAPPFHRTAYRRMLSDMSQRFMTLPQLESRKVLVERECMTPDSQFWSLRPLGGWIRRAISSPPSGR
jgi:hypothetical protein